MWIKKSWFSAEHGEDSNATTDVRYKNTRSVIQILNPLKIHFRSQVVVKFLSEISYAWVSKLWRTVGSSVKECYLDLLF